MLRFFVRLLWALIAIAAALIRGICGNQAKTIGNFWRDVVRLHLYLLLPICFVYAIFLVSQDIPGVPTITAALLMITLPTMALASPPPSPDDSVMCVKTVAFKATEP